MAYGGLMEPQIRTVEFCYLAIPKWVAIILSLNQMWGVVGTVGITTACGIFPHRAR